MISDGEKANEDRLLDWIKVGGGGKSKLIGGMEEICGTNCPRSWGSLCICFFICE